VYLKQRRSAASQFAFWRKSILQTQVNL
jgi:hypothetical protein